MLTKTKCKKRQIDLERERERMKELTSQESKTLYIIMASNDGVLNLSKGVVHDHFSFDRNNIFFSQGN